MTTIRHISALLAAIIVMAATFAACSGREEPSFGDGEGRFQVGMSVVVPALPGQSRAQYEDGTSEYENTVDFIGGDYRIMLFSSDDSKLLSVFDTDSVVLIENAPSAENPAYRFYRLYARVDKSVTALTSLKLVMLANWGDYPDLRPGKTTIDDLAGYAAGHVQADGKATFDAAGHLRPAPGKRMPMFGVKDCADLEWQNFNMTWLGDLWLLRALAKIEVRAGEGSPALASAAVTSYNKRGTCAPKGIYSESQYVTSDEHYKSPIGLTLPGDKNDAADGPAAMQQSADGAFAIYVPEFQILPDPQAPTAPCSGHPRLSLTFETGDKVYYVDFKYYNEETATDHGASVGDYFDIRRNYLYRYTVNLGSGEVLIKVQVDKWNFRPQPEIIM